MASQRLYLVVREHRYDGGRGADVLQSSEPLYCGYDRFEAVRIYHESREMDSRYGGPGSYYKVTKGKSKVVYEEAKETV